MHLVHDERESFTFEHVSSPDMTTGAHTGRRFARNRARLHAHQDQSISALPVRRRRAPLGRLNLCTSKELVHECVGRFCRNRFVGIENLRAVTVRALHSDRSADGRRKVCLHFPVESLGQTLYFARSCMHCPISMCRMRWSCVIPQARARSQASASQWQ